MAKLTEKQNFLNMLYKEEQPEWVPRYAFGPNPYATKPPMQASAGPMFLFGTPQPDGTMKDIWGVTKVTTQETAGAFLPKPGEFILEDVRKWADVIKAPDLSDIDWELMSKRDLENAKINRDEVAVESMLFAGVFQDLMAFMGFTEGLCAMSEEPEAVAELFDYLSKFYLNINKNVLEYYKPDYVGMGDDTATAQRPFVSVQMFEELLMPVYQATADLAIERGLAVNMHNCGRCEPFIENWFKLGVKMWNPAQTMNDLEGIKAKYGNKLILCGCWDSSGPVGWPTATKELVFQTAKEVIDTFAPGGGFVFLGSIYGPVGDSYTEDKKRWLTEAYEEYGYNFYK